mmetsp:Transcript_37804/g.42819  ORF Transcript_37804/g.42819 Transcript_37804/m.42819 type:complete len:189 (+) Transcript_37804:180-746(+)
MISQAPQPAPNPRAGIANLLAGQAGAVGASQADGTSRGFDRFHSMGFSSGEIEQMRAQFHRALMHHGRVSDLSNREELINYEDQWINGELNDVHFSHPNIGHLNPNQNYLESDRAARYGAYDHDQTEEQMGTTLDLVWGFIFGYFLYIIAIIFVMMCKCTKKQRLGIYLGVWMRVFSLLVGTSQANNS